jgi:hypothetical protein
MTTRSWWYTCRLTQRRGRYPAARKGPPDPSVFSTLWPGPTQPGTDVNLEIYTPPERQRAHWTLPVPSGSLLVTLLHFHKFKSGSRAGPCPIDTRTLFTTAAHCSGGAIAPIARKVLLPSGQGRAAMKSIYLKTGWAPRSVPNGKAHKRRKVLESNLGPSPQRAIWMVHTTRAPAPAGPVDIADTFRKPPRYQFEMRLRTGNRNGQWGRGRGQ